VIHEWIVIGVSVTLKKLLAGKGTNAFSELVASAGMAAWRHRRTGCGAGAGAVLTLYFAPGSSSMAPHIALHETGLAFEGRPMSFRRKDMQGPGFLALNPEGKVPVLLIGDRVLTEVAAILLYIARRCPEAGLLPAGIEAEAQVVSWMSFIAATLHPARRQGEAHARQVYGLAERRLGGRDWAVGERCSIADIHLFRLYWRFRGALNPAPGDFPSLEAHHARMLARPAVQRTIAAEAALGYELP
jgi:glutathione S-transferase